MRITFVSDTYDNQVNGVVTTLKKTISNLQKRDHKISLIDANNFRTFRLPHYPEILASWNLWNIGSLIENSEPDCIHIVTEGPLGIAARLWCARHNYNFTTSYHTRFPEYFDQQFGFGSGLAYKALRWFHNSASSVMVNSPGMEAILYDHGFRNIVQWGRGVDTDLYRPDGPIPALYETLPRPIMLNVGRISVEKNLPAFYDLYLPGSMVQVGDGPYLNQFRENFPHVHFVGSKSGEELASYYRGADVFVFPSLTDTFGLVMLESMASGVPVAAFNVTGPKDVVINDRTGILGDLEDAILKALELRNRDIFKEYIREWALSQSWETCTDQFLAALVQK